MAKKYTLSLQLTADGRQAREELEKVAAAAKEAAKAASRPVKFTGSLMGVGGLYGKTLKGFGGDMSRMLGLDKVGSGMQSGLGKALSWAGFGFSALWKAASFALRGIWSGVRLAGSLIKSMLLTPVRLATSAFKALGVGAAAALAGIYAGLKALGPAAEMEQFQIQVETMLKDPAKARQRIAELKKYAKDTNYGPREIIEAGNLMEAFGFYSLRNLKLAGDAANAFGKDIREIVRSLNYLASGRGGEAFESLARIGVTREKLKPFGVQFEKSGELKTDPKKALEAVLLYFEKSFGGMTERQKRTWRGAMQQMGGEVYNAFDVGFKKALKPLTEFVQQRAIPLIDSIGKRLEKIDWKKALARPMKLLGGVAELIRQAMDPKTAEQGMKNLKAFGSSMWEGLKKVLGLLPAGIKAFVGDLAGVLESFIGSGGMGKVLDAGWQMLKAAWQFGASLFSLVLTSFSREFQSGLKIFVERITPGKKEETAKSYNAMLKASKDVADQLKRDNLEEYNRIRKGVVRGMQAEPLDTLYKNLSRDDLFEGNQKEWLNAEVERRIASTQAASQRYLNIYNRSYRRQMGFDDPTTSPFYRDPAKLKGQLDVTLGALSDVRIPELKFEKTAAWGKQFREDTKAAFAEPAGMVAQANAMGSRRTKFEEYEERLRNRRQALIDDPELAGYRREGWNRRGRERDGLKAAEAREAHWRRSALLRGEIGKIDRELGIVGIRKNRNAQMDVSRNTEAIKKLRDAKPRHEAGGEKPRTAEGSPQKSETGSLIDQVGAVNNTIGAGNQQMLQSLKQGFADTQLLLGQNKLQNHTIIQELQRMNGILAEVMGV
jgi:hypothetical protein